MTDALLAEVDRRSFTVKATARPVTELLYRLAALTSAQSKTAQFDVLLDMAGIALHLARGLNPPASDDGACAHINRKIMETMGTEADEEWLCLDCGENGKW